MKAFVAAIVALGVITVGSQQILMQSGFSTAEEGTSAANVRLSD